MLCLEAAPKTSPFPYKVISVQLDVFPGPASCSEILRARFGPLAHRQLIHPLFIFILRDFPQFPLMSRKVDNFSSSSLGKNHTLDQFTAVQRNMSPEDTQRRKQDR